MCAANPKVFSISSSIYVQPRLDYEMNKYFLQEVAGPICFFIPFL